MRVLRSGGKEEAAFGRWLGFSGGGGHGRKGAGREEIFFGGAGEGGKKVKV